MADAFISYSRKDKDFVSTLYAAFERSQKNIWVDWNNIPLTSDWWAEIEKGIEGADTFVFVISPDSIASEVCTKEIDHAVLHNKRLFPIVRRDATNFQVGNDAHKKIQQHNWLMFREQDDFESAFKTLTETISLDLDHLHSHTRLLVRAIEWGKGRSDSLLLRGDDLARAERWLGESEGKDPQPTELQETYIKNSREAEDARARAEQILRDAVTKAALRTKVGIGILSVAILLAGVAVFFGANSLEQADKAQKIASQSKSDADKAQETSKTEAQKALQARSDADKAQETSKTEAQKALQARSDADKAQETSKTEAQKALQAKNDADKAQETSKTEAQKASQAKKEADKLFGETTNLQLAFLGQKSIDQIITKESKPGVLEFLNDDQTWSPIIRKGEQVFAALREFEQGRIFATSHGSVIGDTRLLEAKYSDSQEFVKTSLKWLNGRNGKYRILVSSEHCEVLTVSKNEGLSRWKKQFEEWNYTVNEISAPITDTKLKEADILIIGNAWGNFTQEEIEVVKKFVSRGGGLLAVAIGWDWKNFNFNNPDWEKHLNCKDNKSGQNPNNPSTHPMNRLFEPFDLQWTMEYIDRSE